MAARPDLGVLLVVVLGALPTSCAPRAPFECPWAGEGTATVQFAGDPGASVHGGTITCASGAYLNSGNDDREVQFCGEGFDMNVAIRTQDDGTGVRTVASHALADGSARLTFTVLSSAGNAAYESEPDGTGTISITSNFAHTGDTFAGTFQSVRMTRQTCTVSNCGAYPATITISGTFGAIAR